MIEAATIQTAFGPIISMSRKDMRLVQASSQHKIRCDREPSATASPLREPVDPKYLKNDQDNKPTKDGGSSSGDVRNLIASMPGGQRKGAQDEDEKHPRAPLVKPIEPSPEPERFNNGYIEIRSSSTAGFGAFALSDITRGQTLLIEKALFHASNDSLYDEMDNLTPPLKRAFDRLYAHNPRNCGGSGKDRASIFRTNRYVPTLHDRVEPLQCTKQRSAFISPRTTAVCSS